LTNRESVKRGAYVLKEDENADLTIIGVGAELSLAVDVAARLRTEHNLKARVVSFPCQRLFERQSREYKRDVLRRYKGIPAVVIEPYAANGWERYADAGFCMSVERFGKSLPGPKAYEFFGFETGNIARKVNKWLGEREVGEFVEL
jgi:dihydroxyacetone synthase